MEFRSVLACLCLAFSGVLGSSTAAQSVDIELLHFGAGDVARGGGPLALLVQFRSSLDRVTEIEAVWEIPSADLDIVEHSRRFVLNPGQAQRRWLYGVLPPYQQGTLQSTIFDLRLYELEGGERVRDLGTAKLAPSTAANPPRILGLNDDAFLVVGPRVAGLDIYAQAAQNGTIPSMNTTTAIANARDIEAFPDRWEGLAMFDSIVWVDGSIAPARLSAESARAIEQWTERGGNFVIALPASGDPWSIGVEGRHGFSGLLPSVAPTRIDDVAVNDILPMLSVSNSLRDPKAKTRLGLFEEATLDRGWRPFIATPATKAPNSTLSAQSGPIDGKFVGIRRELGFGHMTLLGIDVEELSARALQVPAIPQGDVFWNRILARRADTPSGAEYTALEQKQRLISSGGYTREIGGGMAIAQNIGLSGEAAIGVLTATAVFGLYWLIAGPLGFAALKAMKRERWSWVAYVGVALVFTVVILLVGRTFAGRTARASHLTVLDMIERAPGENDITRVQRRRAVTWLSVFAPDYGSVELAIDPDGDPTLRNTLESWRPAGSSVEGFPSRERYRLPLDSTNRVTVPSRATTVDFKAQWLGAVPEAWGRMPHAQTPITAQIDNNAATPTIALTGSLLHELPGTLRNVKVMHIWPRRNPLTSLAPAEADDVPVRRAIDPMPNRGVMMDVSDWAPGKPLDMAQVFGDPRPMTTVSGLELTLAKRYYADIEQTARQNVGLGGGDIELEQSMDMLSIYGMLQPPRYLRDNDATTLRITRLGGRELDLSQWLTQPCLIVTGWLDAAPLPYDFTLDGERIESSGRVMVRWVMPLPASSYWIVPDKFPRPSRNSE